MRIVFVHGACVKDGAWWWHRTAELLAQRMAGQVVMWLGAYHHRPVLMVLGALVGGAGSDIVNGGNGFDTAAFGSAVLSIPT